MANLDPALSHLLWEKDYFDKNPSLGTHPVPDDLPIPIGIVYTGDFAAIAALGFKGSPSVGNTAFGSVDIPTLRALAAHPQIVRINELLRPTISLNDSIPDIEANQVWTRSGSTFTGYTGKGVIVGIIDSGININHPVFIDPVTKKTRIQWIWDQTIINPIKPPIAGENPPGAITNSLLGPGTFTINYGVEYKGDTQIQQTLDNPSNANPPCRHEDGDGHGTHVAGIAAGNGAQGGDCFGPYRYIGVAPEATYIIVRLWGLSPGDRGENLDPPQTVAGPAGPGGNELVDAIRYIVNKAKPQGGTAMPLAINLSVGSFDSAQMDGSDAISTKIDALLSQPTVNGLGISIAAGNFAKNGWRIQASIPVGGTIDIPFNIGSNDKNTRTLTFHISDTVQATMDVPYPSGATINAGTPNPTANGPGSSVSVNNTAAGVSVLITPAPGGTNVSGKWTIHLKNTAAAVVNLDGYCDNATQGTGFFFSDTTQWDPLATLSNLACGRECVSVGSYKVSNHSLSDFSSHGPTRGGGPNYKPELSAPGEDIKSAGGSIHCACCCTACQHWYVSKDGTSMASPHVAGAIALLLHKNPTLTNTEIKNALTNNGNFNPPPAGTSASDLAGWGVGRLDAKLALASITAINAPVEAPAMIQAPEEAALLQGELLRTPNGKSLAELFQRHFPEIMDLINHNRRVATIWHRVKGPVWTRLATQAFYNPRLKLQPEIDGLSLTDAAFRFLGILRQYASAALLGEIKPFEPMLADFNREMSLREMIQMVGNYKQETAVWPLQPVH